MARFLSNGALALETRGKSLAVGHDRDCGLPCRRRARYGIAGGKNPRLRVRVSADVAINDSRSNPRPPQHAHRNQQHGLK
jgi:hypothetical protein